MLKIQTHRALIRRSSVRRLDTISWFDFVHKYAMSSNETVCAIGAMSTTDIISTKRMLIKEYGFLDDDICLCDPIYGFGINEDISCASHYEVYINDLQPL